MMNTLLLTALALSLQDAPADDQFCRRDAPAEIVIDAGGAATENAMRLGVTIRYDLLPDGRAANAAVIQSDDGDLDAPSLEAVTRRAYPPREDGEPARGCLIRFVYAFDAA